MKSGKLLSYYDMQKVEKIADFYKRKFNWVPENLREGIGHFNLFLLETYSGENAPPIPYSRRDFYKVMLVQGKSRVYYADKVIEVHKQALSFSNPLIPYKWEHDKALKGFYCIFDSSFFSQFGNLGQYEMFQPAGTPVYELSDEQVLTVKNCFQKMDAELNSDYPHKYDVLRNLVFELIHFALKSQPAVQSRRSPVNASQRIAAIFLELLERQFPVDDTHSEIRLRTASAFAVQLAVHVNHLNRAVKENTGKTTSQLIQERLMQEARILLKHSSWPVSNIAWALGFKEVSHFNNFFKKETGQSPLQFRKT